MRFIGLIEYGRRLKEFPAHVGCCMRNFECRKWGDVLLTKLDSNLQVPAG